MKVTVNLGPGLRRLAGGQDRIELEADTVGGCLERLAKNYPKLKLHLFDKKGELRNYVALYLNQESVYPQELAAPVADGDELHITLLIAGG